ncbi:hypothetical protein GCM10027535_48640 [Mycolicibacterium hippocampi]|uniref:ESX-1 secretion-associated protein EspA/EspE-like domain-containing protein n=1 Tax=Mycolicibacterium hippocampi TaxID=659824 RepID=A0A7I9ZU07_9MYCO|nr:hypothetical protein MHIP_46990 [Mycolicibacterium hippocampi]
MGVLDAFMAVWAKARATFGEGLPQDGSAFDQSATLLRLQSQVQAARPGERWQGPASDAYAVANDQHAGVLGGAARLDRRLRAEVDRSAAVVTAGRRDLDAVRDWVTNAAATVPQTPQGERMLYPVVSRGSGEVVEILQRSHTDMAQIAGRISGIGSEYQSLRSELKLGPGDEVGPGDGPLNAVGDEDSPWTYPFDPPPPPDSAPGGGRWELGQAYPPGPGGGPPMGPTAVPKPWHRSVDPPVVGGTTALQDVVAPPPNGWGEVPPVVVKEAYRFRVTGEGFSNDAGHVRWVQRDGAWYQAQWITHDLEAEHLFHFESKVPFTKGFNDWDPIDIKDVYRLQADNPRLTLYVPDPSGSVLELDPDRPTVSRSQ